MIFAKSFFFYLALLGCRNLSGLLRHCLLRFPQCVLLYYKTDSLQKWHYSLLPNFVEWFLPINSQTMGQMVMQICISSNAENPMWLRHLVTKIFANNYSTKLGNKL